MKEPEYFYLPNQRRAIKVLDHGYVRCVEAFGSGDSGGETEDYSRDTEVGIIEAARQSTQGSFRGWEEGDTKLLQHLDKMRHTTPFEFAGAVIEVSGPIFVFREWHRHRTQSYNEASARYAPLPDLSYEPTVESLLRNTGTTNKQAGTIKGADELTRAEAESIAREEAEFNIRAEQFYQRKLRAGVPKELARTHLPVSRYSKMRALALLPNWIRFLNLRCSPDAQWEIRQFAWAVYHELVIHFPQTLGLWYASIPDSWKAAA